MVARIWATLASMDANTWIALAAVVVAVASAIIAAGALWLAWWTAQQTRQHNILSVRPKVTGSLAWRKTAPQFTLSIANNGLGPALIEEIRVSTDGEGGVLTRGSQWPDIIDRLGVFDSGAAYSVAAFAGSYSLRPGAELQMVQVCDNTRPYEEADLRGLTRRLRVAVDYTCMYGRKDTAHLN